MSNPHEPAPGLDVNPPAADTTTADRAAAADHSASNQPDQHSSDPEGNGDQNKHYWRFAAMIATSMVAMFILTYVTTYRRADVQWSETRFFMAFVMGAAMAVIMLSFMLGMYRNRMMNVVIYVGSAVVFVLALWLVRSQTTVQDSSFMRAMIPHHSVAILTSSRAEFDDVRVRQLANEIIDAQKREIAEMNWLLDDIAENGPVTSESDAEARPVPDFTASDYED